MSRLAVPYPPEMPDQGNLAKASPAKSPGDDYKDRLVKYIPAESLAVYTFTDKLVTAFYGINDAGKATKPVDFLFDVLPPALFVIALVGTPIYLWRMRVVGQPWVVHATLSTIAFFLWAYALNGSFLLIHQWYHPLLAALTAPVFTFVAGAIEPRK